MTQVLKMEGLGNNFVLIRWPYDISRDKVRSLCDPKCDGGADGVLVVTPLDSHCIKMQYWNADGSEAEMCGNGLRCAARFSVDHNLVKPGEFTVITKAGKLKAFWDGKDPNKIECQVGRVTIVTEPIVLEGRYFYIVDVGNPHCITFVDDVATAPVTTLGPVIEVNKNFPRKTNVEFVQIISPSKISVRVWERGVGETQACGTGMVAAARLSKEIKKTNLPATVQVSGGEAQVWLDNEGCCRMRGPAEYIEIKL
jgi:diaminopimelate epimerase